MQSLFATFIPVYSDNRLIIYYKVQKRSVPTFNNPTCSNFQPGGASGTTTIEAKSISAAVVDSGSSNTSFAATYYNASTILTMEAEL